MIDLTCSLKSELPERNTEGYIFGCKVGAIMEFHALAHGEFPTDRSERLPVSASEGSRTMSESRVTSDS